MSVVWAMISGVYWSHPVPQVPSVRSSSVRAPSRPRLPSPSCPVCSAKRRLDRARPVAGAQSRVPTLAGLREPAARCSRPGSARHADSAGLRLAQYDSALAARWTPPGRPRPGARTFSLYGISPALRPRRRPGPRRQRRGACSGSPTSRRPGHRRRGPARDPHRPHSRMNAARRACCSIPTPAAAAGSSRRASTTTSTLRSGGLIGRAAPPQRGLRQRARLHRQQRHPGLLRGTGRRGRAAGRGRHGHLPAAAVPLHHRRHPDQQLRRQRPVRGRPDADAGPGRDPEGQRVGRADLHHRAATSQTQDRQLRDLDFEYGRFFWVVDPRRLPALSRPRHPEPRPVTVPPTAPAGAGPGVPLPAPQLQAARTPTSAALPPRATHRRPAAPSDRCAWQLLVQGADYYVDPSGLWFALSTKLDPSDYLAVSYMTATATTVGSFPRPTRAGTTGSLRLGHARAHRGAAAGPDQPTFRTKCGRSTGWRAPIWTRPRSR